MADCAFTDSATVLLSSGVNSTGRTAGNAINAAAPTDAGVTAGPHGWVASVDFEWVMGSIATGATAPAISNVTQDQAEVLLSAGFLPAAYLTGSSGDGS